MWNWAIFNTNVEKCAQEFQNFYPKPTQPPPLPSSLLSSLEGREGEAKNLRFFDPPSQPVGHIKPDVSQPRTRTSKMPHDSIESLGNPKVNACAGYAGSPCLDSILSQLGSEYRHNAFETKPYVKATERKSLLKMAYWIGISLAVLGLLGFIFASLLGGCFRDFPDLFDFFGDFLDFWDFRIFWMFGIIFGTFWIYGIAFWISLLEIFRISFGFFGEIPKIPRILKQILKIPNNLNIGISGIIWIFLGFSGFSWDFYDFCDSCHGLMFSFL